MSKASRRRSAVEGPAVPPRGPALTDQKLLVSFDINCGPLLPGHDFIARGLSDDGDIFDSDEYGINHGPAIQGFSFEYELAPGILPTESHDFPAHLVGIGYSADVALPWDPTDGGALAPFEGGATTHGSRGTWPLPDGARHLTFELYAVPHGARWPDSVAAGHLDVDLQTSSATWHLY